MECIVNEAVYGEAYNLSAPEQIDYKGFLDVLAKAHGEPLSLQPVTVAQVYMQNIPLPFPLDTDELYVGDKTVAALGMEYTPFVDAMKETYDIYMSVNKK